MHRCLPGHAGQLQQYILTSSGLLEVNRVKHPNTCWLVDNTFLSGAHIMNHTAVSSQWPTNSRLDLLMQVLLQCATWSAQMLQSVHRNETTDL